MVATVALGLMMRVTWHRGRVSRFVPTTESSEVACQSSRAGRSTVVRPVPMWVLVGLSVVFGVAAMIADRREIHVRVG